uniref:Reverse transcriptase domain-containing protein n=1 Tax=Acrobeloides nanus TaxID=290746 RepID=A0A914DA22_9BILA
MVVPILLPAINCENQTPPKCHDVLGQPTNTSKFWSGVKELTGTNTLQILPDLEKDGRTASTDHDKAAFLGQAFHDVYAKATKPDEVFTPADQAATAFTDPESSPPWLPICTEDFVNDWLHSLQEKECIRSNKSSRRVFRRQKGLRHGVSLETHRSIGRTWAPTKLASPTHFSQEFDITSGVPQGSVLGPLLFIIFIDQVFDLELSPNAKMVMFADDLAYVKPITIACRNKNKEEEEPCAEEELRQDLKKISVKYKDLSLSLNGKKCKSMLFTTSNGQYDLDLEIGEEKIEQVQQFCYLGIEMYPKL